MLENVNSSEKILFKEELFINAESIIQYLLNLTFEYAKNGNNESEHNIRLTEASSKLEGIVLFLRAVKEVDAATQIETIARTRVLAGWREKNKSSTLK